MARHHRRQKQDVRRAVTESATRVRADIEALSDKVDQFGSKQNRLSRRSLLMGLAGLGVAVLTWIFPRQRQVGRDVTFSVTSDHGVRGAGTPQIASGKAGGRHHHVNLSMSARAGLPSATFRFRARVVPAEQTRSV